MNYLHYNESIYSEDSMDYTKIILISMILLTPGTSTPSEQRSSNGENVQHNCSICKAPFSNNSSLVRHKTQHESKNLECLLCAHRCHYKWNLNNHVITHYTAKSNRLECPSCHYFFNKQQSQLHKQQYPDQNHNDVIVAALNANNGSMIIMLNTQSSGSDSDVDDDGIEINPEKLNDISHQLRFTFRNF